MSMHTDFEELNNECAGLQIKLDETMQTLCDVKNDLHKEGKECEAQNKESKDGCERNANWKSNMKRNWRR